MTTRHESSDYKAWIVIEPGDSGIRIRPFCQNNTSEDVVLRYEMKAKKTGRSGTSQSSQSGSVEIAAGQEKSLSRLNLGVSGKDRYEINLKVYKDGKLVAKDSVSHP